MSRSISKYLSMILSAILVVALATIFTACAPEDKTDEPDSTPDPNEVTEERFQSATEVSQSELGLVEENTDSAYEEDETVTNLNSPDEERPAQADEPFESTQEEPLAPPADDAEGVAEASEGTISLVVSIDGGTGPMQLVDGLTVELIENIDIQVSLVNNTPDTITLMFPNSQKLDVILTDSGGIEVYRWSQGMRFAQVVSEITLEAGEVWSHELSVYKDKMEGFEIPGSYDLKVIMTGTPEFAAGATGIELVKAGS